MRVEDSGFRVQGTDDQSCSRVNDLVYRALEVGFGAKGSGLGLRAKGRARGFQKFTTCMGVQFWAAGLKSRVYDFRFGV